MKPGRTVLVVDDEPSIVDGLRLTLEAEGYAVRIAGSVATALDALVQGDVQAAIVDLMLPDGDGLALTRELARQGADLAQAYASTPWTVEALSQNGYKVQLARVAVKRALLEAVRGRA